MKFSFGYVLMVSLSVECFCIGPDWNNHPIMQQAIEDKAESYTTAYINITYTDETGQRRNDKTESGKFGETHIQEASGLLIHVRQALSNGAEDPFTACRLPLKASYGSLPNEPWIALVKRGGCSFQQKVENAFYSNASGIIIYNDKESSNLDKMRLTQNVPSK